MGSSLSNSTKGFLYAFFGMSVQGTAFVMAKYGVSGFDPRTFSLIWTVSASLFLLCGVVAGGHQGRLYLSRRSLYWVVLQGAITSVGMITGWAGLALLEPSFASFIWRFAPVAGILLGTLVLREKLHVWELPPIVIMLAGGILSAIGTWEVVGLGVILTLIACVSGSVQFLIAKLRVKDIPPIIMSFYRVTFASGFIFVWWATSGESLFQGEPRQWLFTFLGASLGPGLSVFMLFKSSSYWDMSRTMIVSIAQPLFILPVAWLFLDSFPTVQQLVGGVIIMLGAFWLSWMHYCGRGSVEKSVRFSSG